MTLMMNNLNKLELTQLHCIIRGCELRIYYWAKRKGCLPPYATGVKVGGELVVTTGESGNADGSGVRSLLAGLDESSKADSFGYAE